MNVLVISAHPDDETIGAGGTIARHVDHGDRVYWCIVTQGHSPTWPEDVLVAARKQVEQVKETLGIYEVFNCGFPTVKLNTIPQMDICSAIKNVIDTVQPEVVYTTPAEDINQDHRIVYDATLVAARPLPGCSVKRLLAYEITTTSKYGNVPFHPNVYIDISMYLEKKLAAFSCYKTEIKEWPHPRSVEGLRLLSRERGLAIAVEAAECFSLVHEIL